MTKALSIRAAAGSIYRDDGLGQRCFASGRRQSCQKSTDRSTWQSQPASGRFKLAGLASFGGVKRFMRLNGYMQTDSPRRVRSVQLWGDSKQALHPNQSATNAGHQGERQERGERQGQQLQAPQQRTPPGHLMGDTWGTGAAVQNRSTPRVFGYTAWIQAIQHRWILKFDTQISFSSSIHKTELVLQIKNSTRIFWNCSLKTSFGEVC